MTPEKESLDDEMDGSPCPSSPFSRASTLPLEMVWDSTSPSQLSARSEPGFSVLRASSVSPRMVHLASGLAEIGPIGGSAPGAGAATSSAHGGASIISPVPIFSLALASPIPSPMIPSLTRISPANNGASSRILHSSPCRSLKGSLQSQSSSDLSPRFSSSQPHNSPHADPNAFFLSSSISSLEDCASTTTDSSDYGRFSDDPPSPPPATQFFSTPDSVSLLPSFGSHTSPSIPLGSTYDIPSRSNSDGTRRLRARTVHAERSSLLSNPENCPEVVSSPTRSRGGTSSGIAQRTTTTFLSNPRPGPTRGRKDSATNRPKPKLSESVELPKVVPVSGLIPNLKGVTLSTSNTIPASPSRPKPLLPHLKRSGERFFRLTAQTVRFDPILVPFLALFFSPN
jgi:hypothetical protein